MENDESLFARFLEGNEMGLELLMERYGDSLTYYINGYIHDLNDAEDLMIEAFARVAAKQPHFTDYGFKAYLYKTGRNLALRHAGRLRLYRHFGLDDTDVEPVSPIYPEHIAQKREQNSVLRRCMNKLCRNYREALYLVFFEDLSHAEAAEVLGKNEKQVDNMICRGKQALRRLLEEEGITDAR